METSMKATATYSPTKWDEKPYEQISPSMKLTRASVEFAFHGQMEGHGLVEYLMFYKYFDESDPHKATATYVGLITFKGTLNGVAGSFAMEDRGTFEAGAANSVLTIIPGSGTDKHKGITGTGKYTATQKGCECELNYELK
jgi:hypothetical protein